MPSEGSCSRQRCSSGWTGLYDLHGEKLRFLIVGVWNTLFSVLTFNLLLLVFGREYYLPCFWASWIVSIPQSTLTMKYLAFRRGGPILAQVARAFLIYLPAQGLATAIMWFTVQVLNLLPSLAQLITIVVTTVFSYLGHKYFTFRVPVGLNKVSSEDGDILGQEDQARDEGSRR